MAGSDPGERARRAGFRPASLDAVNFLLADVRGALGPYLNVFLVTQQRWSQTEVGWVTTISGLLGLAGQVPAGAAIDATPHKRGIVVLALVVLALGTLGIFADPRFWPVLTANSAIGLVGDVFGPAVAAMTLGLYARPRLARRMGRNAAFDHAGNIAVAAAAAGVGHLVSQRAVFLLVPVFAVLAAAATLSIPGAAIDADRARGLGDGDGSPPGGTAPSGLPAMIRSRPLVVFASCAMLFHFANAPLLPLVGQKLAQAHPAWATAMMSSCIVAAQLIMLPVALAAGWTADRFGRKPVLLAGFAVLPVRALLYPFSDGAAWLIGVQLLDGIGAGVLGAITPLVVADLMRGTGRYNLAQGVVATAQGLGASLSGLAAGVVVDRSGYATAFRGLGATACVALAVLFLAMPETAPRGRAGAGGTGQPDGTAGARTERHQAR